MTQPIIKRSRVQQTVGQPAKATPVQLGGSASSCAPGERQVRLVEEDGRVLGIEITCSCGEVTAVELQYPDGPAA
jgi:hypothetical protein